MNRRDRRAAKGQDGFDPATKGELVLVTEVIVSKLTHRPLSDRELDIVTQAVTLAYIMGISGTRPTAEQIEDARVRAGAE